MRPSEKPPSCLGCPAYDWGVGFVPAEIPKRPTNLAWIGQGPGEMEAKFSRPFFPNAPSGRKCDSWLNRSKWQRTRTLISNVVWCWLPKAKPNGVPVGNRHPTDAEIAYCRPRHLDPVLRAAGFGVGNPTSGNSEGALKVVCAVGAPAARSLTGIDKTEKYLGSYVEFTLEEPHVGYTTGDDSRGEVPRPVREGGEAGTDGRGASPGPTGAVGPNTVSLPSQ